MSKLRIQPLRSCLEIVSTFQDATRKGPTIYAFAGSGQRAAPNDIREIIPLPRPGSVL